MCSIVYFKHFVDILGIALPPKGRTHKHLQQGATVPISSSTHANQGSDSEEIEQTSYPIISTQGSPSNASFADNVPLLTRNEGIMPLETIGIHFLM